MLRIQKTIKKKKTPAIIILHMNMLNQKKHKKTKMYFMKQTRILVNIQRRITMTTKTLITKTKSIQNKMTLLILLIKKLLMRTLTTTLKLKKKQIKIVIMPKKVILIKFRSIKLINRILKIQIFEDTITIHRKMIGGYKTFRVKTQI